MPDLEKVMLALSLCAADDSRTCNKCPYAMKVKNGVRVNSSTCIMEMAGDALELIKEYDTALKLMVFQYCVDDKNFYHRFMCAGEEAFRVLGIENGQLTDGVWEKWFPDVKGEGSHA